MARIVTEAEFRERFLKALDGAPPCDYVVGAGRSGAIAAVYASHYLGVPFLPYKCKVEGKRALVVDTAMESGATLRKASRLYGNAPTVFAFSEPPRVKFWYENLKG